MIEYLRPYWVGVSVSCFVLTPSALGGEDREQLLATARDGNRAAIQSIISMECCYENKPWANFSLEQANEYFHVFSPGRFWQSGDTYRLFKPMGDGTTLDCVVRNRQGHCLRKGGPLPRPILTFETDRPVDGVGGDMWHWLLFSHWGRNPLGLYPLDEILQHPYVLHKAERLPPPANDIHIELSHSNGRSEFWFDPKVNYLVRKRVVIPQDPSRLVEGEVIEFAEPAPAVFLPVIVEHRYSINGKLQAVMRTILSDVKVNQPLAQDALRIPGIAGMDCIDLNRDMKYKVDADGNAVGPESPVKVARISPPARMGGGPFIPPYDSSSLLQPSRPPTPLWVWILIVSLIALIAAGILTIVRRRRQAKQA